MFTGLFTLIKMGSIWSRIGAILSDACTALAGWITRNRVAALIVALCLAVVGCGWYIHHQHGQIVAAKSAGAQDLKALTVEQGSNARLNTAITQQNAAVAQLGTDSAAAVAQGNQADAAAVARSTARAAQSARIIVPPAAPAQADCRTPDDVMAVKGGL